jgi:hypothetical protein
MKRAWLGLLAILMIVMAALFYVGRYFNITFNQLYEATMSDADRTYLNYKDSVVQASNEFNLPPEYLLALITLESSGRKVVPKRFEPRVYQRLKRVKSGNRSSMEDVSTNDLREVNDAGLRNLASSWGPFQIMGYKSYDLGIYVADIRGERSVYHGARWIDRNYGDELRKGQFKDAFHIHNTGKPFPADGRARTHNPNYVVKGLELVRYFKQRLLEEVS